MDEQIVVKPGRCVSSPDFISKYVIEKYIETAIDYVFHF